MANKYNNELLSLLEDKQFIIIENGANFTFSDKCEETEYIKKINYDLQKHYIIEGEKYVIMNLDFDTIKPFTRYCLKDIYKSLEYKAIIVNRIIQASIVFLLLIVIFSNFSWNSTSWKIYEKITSDESKKVEKTLDPKKKYDAPIIPKVQQINEKPIKSTNNRWWWDF